VCVCVCLSGSQVNVCKIFADVYVGMEGFLCGRVVVSVE
jgi:hypothetical protein